MAEDVKSFLGVPKASIKSVCGVLAASSIAAVCRVPWIGGGDRGVFGGGYVDINEQYSDTIDYITISSIGNAIDFGNLTVGRIFLSATSNGTNDRGVFGGGTSPNIANIIDYIAISSIGDALDFGNLIYRDYHTGSTSNGTNDRGIFGGGGYPSCDKIRYIAISSIGDALDFGALTVARNSLAATSNGTNDRGIFGGGYRPDGQYAYDDTIDYITISSASAALDFGNLIIGTLVQGVTQLSATSNGTNDRGVFAGGSIAFDPSATIDYITITSAGNSIDFGGLTQAKSGLSATSNGVSDRGVFGSGSAYNTFNIVDYITISSIGYCYDFGDLTKGRHSYGAASNS